MIYPDITLVTEVINGSLFAATMNDLLLAILTNTTLDN